MIRILIHLSISIPHDGIKKVKPASGPTFLELFTAEILEKHLRLASDFGVQSALPKQRTVSRSEIKAISTAGIWAGPDGPRVVHSNEWAHKSWFAAKLQFSADYSELSEDLPAKPILSQYYTAISGTSFENPHISLFTYLCKWDTLAPLRVVPSSVENVSYFQFSTV
jgi:hypothetical protein